MAGLSVNHRIEREQLTGGDHIYAHTALYAYSHHAIYDDKGFVIHHPCRTGLPTVERISLVEFLDVHNCRLYKYGVNGAKEKVAVSGTVCKYSRNDCRNSLDLARWFAAHPDVFGRYDASSWNCEHFATFCCTTWLTVAALEDALAEGKLTRQYLLGNSHAWSGQTQKALPHLRAAARVASSPLAFVVDTVTSHLP